MRLFVFFFLQSSSVFIFSFSNSLLSLSRPQFPHTANSVHAFFDLDQEKEDQNGAVLELGEPGQNRFNRSGSRFCRSNRRFPVFGRFFHFSGFFGEPDRIEHRSPVEPVEPAGPVRFLKP
jgi:hypothetical protein